MERLAFTVIVELRCEDGFDVVWVDGENETVAESVEFDGVVVFGCFAEVGLPGFEVAVVECTFHCSEQEIKSCLMKSYC